MKLKKDLNLEQIVRWTGGFSVLFICTFLIDSAVDLKAQESEPKSFTPGSIPGQPFPQTEHSVRVASTEWSVPVTEAEAISWEPPQTLAQESPSDLIENTISDPPFPLTDELPIDVSEAAKSVVEQVSSSINDTTEATEAALDNSEASQLIEDVPAIPDTPAFELPDPVTEPVEDLEENFGLSVIAEGSSEPEGVATTESSCEPCSSPAAGIGTGRSYLNAPVPQLFTPVRNILGGFSSRLAGNESVHAVGQLTLLSLGRDYRGKGRLLTNGGPNLLAIGPDEGDFTGVDISYGRRRAGGKGWEMRYIGFAPESATDVSSGAPFLVWGGLTPPLNDPATWGGTVPNGLPETFGLSGLGIGGLNMGDIFNDAQNHRVTRDSEFGSFEMNLLRATTGGTRLSCGNSTVELFGGLRGLAFNETTTFTAGGTQAATFPRSAFYSSEVKNSLFGLQVGGRLERQLQKGWGYTFGTRVGIYNNRVENRQRAAYQFDDGSTSVPLTLYGDEAGTAFDVTGTDNELAFLGELDFGIVYQFRARTRARFGYRGIVITNVADAAGQFEDSLFDLDLVAEPNTSSDFLVGGLYFGVDHAF